MNYQRTILLHIANIFMLGMAAFCLQSCHDDDDDGATEEQTRPKRAVYFFESQGGPGDNGYNDIISSAETTFMFMHPDIVIHIMKPKSLSSAKTLYQTILTSSVKADSILIVMNGSDYSQIVREVGDIPVRDNVADMKVLLFEDKGDSLPQGVYSFDIQRYGASYVVGRLAKDTPALVIAAMKGDFTVDEAVQGFLDGYGKESTLTPQVHYLADDVSGFDAATDAIHVCDSVARQIIPKDIQRNRETDEKSPGLVIFPVAGGSNVGVYRYVAAKWSWTGLNAIGMDGEYSNLSEAITMSISIPLYKILFNYLDGWSHGEEWPLHQTFTLWSDDPSNWICTMVLFNTHCNYNFLHWIDEDGWRDPTMSEPIFEKFFQYMKEAYQLEQERIHSIK